MEFEKIHPFQDGNGRIGRFIFIKQLLENKLPLKYMNGESSDEYKKALSTSTNEDINISSITAYKGYIKKVIPICEKIYNIDFLKLENTVDVENYIEKLKNIEDTKFTNSKEKTNAISALRAYAKFLNNDHIMKNQKNETLKGIDYSEEFKIKTLNFEDKDVIQKRVRKALKAGKHIILSGPPGTGKSKLAKEICEFYKMDYKLTTAIADWTTYETVGGYNIEKNGELKFNSGIFLSCFKDRENENINKWLIVDEMNRADIDKAFGVFFSILAGDDVYLNYKANNDEYIKIVNEKDNVDVEKEENIYIVPKDWRLIGTINTVDKASLFEMSYAFMRRFAIIPIGIPKNINEKLIKEYLEIWNIEVPNDIKLVEGLCELWKIINKYRPIGPAILKDIANYIEDEEDWTSVLIMYVLPQFEGIDEDEMKTFINDLFKLEISLNENELYDFIKDFFEIDLNN